MNIFADIRTAVVETLDAMVADGELPMGLDYGAVAVEPPRDNAHGDMATNAAMVLAGRAERPPREIAERLAGRITSDPRIEAATVAGPGFLNLRLAPVVWADVVTDALDAGRSFGRSGMGAGVRVNVEFVSANPTGPLHVGHVRGAVFGDALSALLDFAGYDVTREYYINDGGAQVETLARSVYLRYLEALGQEVEFAEGHYPGRLPGRGGRGAEGPGRRPLRRQGRAVWLEEVRDFATAAMMELIREDLASLGVRHDVFYSEKSLYGSGRIEEALRVLDRKGLIYRGTLEPPKGRTAEDWEPREQTLFRSTEHGDDVDRPVRKSDGSWTYFAPDIAYHHDKIERGFEELIDVFGADHGGYVRRMQAAVAALSDGSVPLDVKLTQLVKLMKGGQPARMSKRAGTFVTLRDVVDEVGPDVVRFHMLTRKNDAPLDFDFDRVTEQSRDNPVYYVQYAHARVRSLWRKAEGMGIMTTDVPLLEDEAEVAVARKIAEWPRVVEIAARNHEPHRLAFYLYELASAFHALWNKGNDMPSLRFIQEDDEARSAAKMALARCVAVVIATGLGILGVTPAEEMR